LRNAKRFATPHFAREFSLKNVITHARTLSFAILLALIGLRAVAQTPVAEQPAFQPLPLAGQESVPRPLPKHNAGGA
jgi:hypothetical protein